MIKVMGILNITPDSFSDGARFYNKDAAFEQAQKLINDGADLIDIGAESTRPGALPVDTSEELRRLMLIAEDIQELGVTVSLDSRNYATVRKLIEYIDIINDQSGGVDDDILDLARVFSKKIVLMHSLTLPAKRSRCIPEDADIVQYLKNWLEESLKKMEKRRLKLESVIFDPGIGFGIRGALAFKLLKEIHKFKDYGVEIMVGHSRKSFLDICGEKEPDKRDLETHIMSFYLAQKGVDYLRVHDVAGTKKALTLHQALEG